MTAELDRLRELASAATPGPWGWFGNAGTHDLYLATRHGGRRFVMQFATWPFQPAGESPTIGDVALEHAPAQPRFRTAPDDSGHMADAAPRLRYEVLGNVTIEQNTARGPVQARALYREDISGIDFPDADYIAAASPDVILTLLDLLDANAAELARFERERHDVPPEREPCQRCGSTGDDCHLGGGDCEEDGHVIQTLNVEALTTTEHAERHHLDRARYVADVQPEPDMDRQPVTAWPRLRHVMVCEDCLSAAVGECTTPGCALNVDGRP